MVLVLEAAHWHDVLLCYGAHSEYLRVSVVTVAHQLCNTIMSWDDVHALFASRLIALDKLPGIRSMGIRALPA